MNIEPKEKEKKGPGFFRVSGSAIREIAIKFQQPEHVAAYIVLSRHAPGSGKLASKVSTAGLKAVVDKAKLSRTTAELVLKDLQDEGFISKRIGLMDSNLPLFLGNKQGIGNTIRWVINNESEDDELIYFPNVLTDGVAKGKNNPPLCKIMSVPGIGKYTPKEVRLDALMVLIKLYHQHELYRCGGVNPISGIYRKWGVAADTTFADEYGFICDVDSLSFMAIDSKNAETTKIANTRFIRSALPYIENRVMRNDRFWYAFSDILMNKLSLVYEVLQVWDSDPADNVYAEVLYPLYIFNRHRREKELSLYKSINSAVIKVIQTTPEYLNVYSDYGCEEEMNDKYIYVKTVGGAAYPLSVYRLQYKPNTQDASRWLERENNSIYEWDENISWLDT
jgi:hypothetical protein